ncbi:MFS transporter [Geodermatophilus obscurus]|uniref:MFS transporter n=1 Tax=Geodermatophilus obscurus TaxID=1861 RepID=UPI001140A9A6|nr:MFS transporter [Geodermatophilus obscurus]
MSDRPRPGTAAAAGTLPAGRAQDPLGSTHGSPDRERWSLVVAAGLAVFMAMLDSYAVVVALPDLGTSLAVTPGLLPWVVLAYSLAMAAVVLPAGRWLDGVGHRPALLIAVGAFAAAGVGCALAPSIEVLLAARVVQGAAAAVLTALTPVLAAVAVAPQRRGRAMGVVSVLGPLGALTGPAVGGWLAEAVGWWALFLLDLPVAVTIAAIALRSLPAGQPVSGPDRRLVAQVVLLGGAVLAILAGLSLASRADLAWAATAVLAVPLLLVWARLPSSAPVLHLLTVRSVTGGLAALALVSVVTSGLIYAVPLALAGRDGSTAVESGLALSALSLAMLALAPVAGMLADRFGADRVAMAGAVLAATGLVVLLPVDPTWGVPDLSWRLAVVGAGTSLFVGPNQALLMTAAPRPLLGSTGGASGAARAVGFGLGPALVSATWTTTDGVAGLRWSLVVLCSAAVLAAGCLHASGRRSRTTT